MTPWDSNRDCGRRRPTLDLIRLESDAIRSLSSLFELTGTRKSLRRAIHHLQGGPDLRLADSRFAGWENNDLILAHLYSRS